MDEPVNGLEPIGELEFEHVNLQVSGSPDLKLMLYTASPSTAEKLKKNIFILK